MREPKNTKNEKWSCFIDGKQTSKQEAGSQIDAGIVDLIEFAPDSRSALLQYGEKYRYGIYIFVTNDKGKK